MATKRRTGSRQLQALPSADETAPKGLTAPVEATVAALRDRLQPEDEALAALAVEYARTIDRAAVIAAAAARLQPTEDLAEEVKRLAARVSAQATMADLGPKLQAALDALGATPKARSSVGKSLSGPRKSALAALRTGVAS